jgi:SAM-dependent methyltransferase
MTQQVDDVRQFWEDNPLWTGESQHPEGSREFFAEHREVYIKDCFAGSLDDRIFPKDSNSDCVLDLGCGPGFWTVEIGKRGCKQLWAADLTKKAIDLAALRCKLYDIDASFQVENAENLTFEDGCFSHVNCQGVIHHTPDTAACVREIARVLRSGGTASISVYYRNAALRLWPVLSGAGKLCRRLGFGMRGRGREGIFTCKDPDEIVRMYDGADNPIGKAYSKKQFIELLSPHFEVKEIFYHFFPARATGIKIPQPIHRFLDHRLPFMIYATLQRR